MVGHGGTIMIAQNQGLSTLPMSSAVASSAFKAVAGAASAPVSCIPIQAVPAQLRATVSANPPSFGPIPR
jgi:hypothetical protein